MIRSGVIHGCLICLAAVMFGMVPAVFAEDECGNAVDAADSMDVNRKDCDYSDKGLNGFLQKAFKKSDEGAVLKTSSAQPQKIDGVMELSVEIETWANVALAKQQMLPKLMERCPKGFSLVGEGYLPLPMGRIQLVLQYQCL